MSDPNKSNFQAFGAGLLGFVGVLAIGGGAIMVHSSHRAQSAARPASAGAPIDIGSSAPGSPLSSTLSRTENRAQSPAPLIGDEDESEAMESSAAAPATAASSHSAASAAAAAAAASRLEVSEHLDVRGNSSTAMAVVKNTIAQEKDKKPVKADKKIAAEKLKPLGDGDTAVAAVHYGVTSRSELMGRAAGPVYNFKGGGAGKAGSASRGEMAGDANAKIADIKRQLEKAGLPDAQREKLLKELNAATEKIAEMGKAQPQ